LEENTRFKRFYSPNDVLNFSTFFLILIVQYTHLSVLYIRFERSKRRWHEVYCTSESDASRDLNWGDPLGTARLGMYVG